MTAREAAAQAERMRNTLAFMLVGAFIVVLPIFMFKVIPSENKDIITYQLGQLSGMALMALGFYFTNKAGQDALDTQRTDTTGKLADAITAASTANAPPPDVLLRPGETAKAEEEA